MNTEKYKIKKDVIQPDDIVDYKKAADNIKNYDYKKAIEQIPSYALLFYIIITIGFMIWAFYKQYTPNNSNKMIRLFNFFWLIPIKINIILSVILALIKLFKVLFGVIFVKLKDKEFPSAFLFFLNYGIVFCLILYTLLPKSLYLIIIFYLMFGVAFVAVDVLFGLLGISYKKGNEMLFPFKFTKKIEDFIKTFQPNDDDNKMSPIEGLFVGIIFAIYIFFFLLFIGSIILSIIPLSYFIAFVYTFKIPTSSEVDSFKKRRKAILLDRMCRDRPHAAEFIREQDLWKG